MEVTRRERMMRMGSDESAYGIATVLKCGVLLGLVALLALIGVSARHSDADASATASANQVKASASDGDRAEPYWPAMELDRHGHMEIANQGGVGTGNTTISSLRATTKVVEAHE